MSLDLDIVDLIIKAIEASPKVEPRWLSLEQAAAYAHIGTKRLITLAETGKIAGGRDDGTKSRDWIFDRRSIDAYRAGQMRSARRRETSKYVAQFLRQRC